MAGSTTRRAGDRAWVGWALLALPTLYFLALVAYPLINLMRMSFAVPQRGRVFGEGFSFQNYITIFTDELYLETLWVTFRIGALTALLALLLGVPLALYIRRARPGVRSLLIFITIAPILVSVVVRAYGWIVLLSNRGLINTWLQGLGFISEPLTLVRNELGVIIGMTNRSLPGLNNTLCLSPALIATHDDIDAITHAIDKALVKVFH